VTLSMICGIGFSRICLFPWESMPKVEKVWESVLKVEKVWESVPKPEKVCESMVNANGNANCYLFVLPSAVATKIFTWGKIWKKIEICYVFFQYLSPNSLFEPHSKSIWSCFYQDITNLNYLADTLDIYYKKYKLYSYFYWYWFTVSVHF